LTLSNVTLADAGQYSVVVTDDTGSVPSNPATLTVTPTTYSSVLTRVWQLAPGSRQYLATDNAQRGLAYNPTTGNLILVSRTGSNQVDVLDSATGAHVRNLAVSDPPIAGGTFAVNQVRVSDDGTVWVGNLTTNGSIDEFRLYSWIDDSAESLPYLAWRGNPGGTADTTNRWGDTMDVRSGPNGPELLVGSRAGQEVSVITPGFGETSFPLTFTVYDVAPGAFAHGVAWGAGDTIWGKSLNGALVHVGLDFDFGLATLLHSYTGLPPLGPIGTDPALGLLAGVSIDTPDNLRLYDVGDLMGGPINVDTEFFPTDNANGNNAGAVDFGPNRVFALDANNGILAMTLAFRPRLRMSVSGDTATFTWSGTYSLLYSDDLVNWCCVSGATSGHQVTIPSGAGQRFYALGSDCQTCP
jgi:hypothetical protein